MKTYPHYGLGDLQFEMMIDQIIEKEQIIKHLSQSHSVD